MNSLMEFAVIFENAVVKGILQDILDYGNGKFIAFFA